LLITLCIIYRTWVGDTVESLLNWVKENPAIGALVMSLVYIVATLLFIPGSLLTLGAGWAF